MKVSFVLRRLPRVFAVVSLLVLLLALSACGKKARPEPPEASAPEPVRFLLAKADVDAVILTWRAPEKDASGDSLEDLAGYVVKRSDYEKDERPDFEEIAEVEAPLDLSDEAPKGEREAAKKVEYVYRDTEVEAGKTYEYVVLPINDSDVEGGAAAILRVTFIGTASVIENFSAEQRAKTQ